jgi:micrococcal nuclease
MKFCRFVAVALLTVTGCSVTQSKSEVSQQSSPTTEVSPPVANPTVAQNVLPQVVSVGDGDTLQVTRGNDSVTVRLGCIDAPETAQTPWGRQSANRLKQLLPVGQAVQVREIDRDKYDRTVAELYLGNQSVNLMMVKEGQAVVYPEYLSGCANTQNQYLQAEAQAKAQKLGFWNQANPVMPWEFRQGKRSNNQSSSGARPRPTTATSPSPTPTTTPRTNCDPAYPDVCIPSPPPDLDCKDIQFRNFKVLSPDPHGFDGRDKDGIGCESKK